MFSSFASVGFCGSRSLPASARPLVTSVVSAVCSGSTVRSVQLVVGCSVGADALVLSSVPRHMLSNLTVFAAFGFGGRGSCSLSAVPAVLAASRGGARIRWWAGGLPDVPLHQRLALRSVALVRFLARHASSFGGLIQRPPSALICFLSSPRSRGSLIACRRAARSGVTVFAFCVGFSPAIPLAGSFTIPLAGSPTCLPRLHHRGFWIPIQVAGLPTVIGSSISAYRWEQL